MPRTIRTAGPSRSTGTAHRWRITLAGLVAAALAAVGIALAAPASAEELPPTESSIEVTVTDCATYGGLGSIHYVVRDPFVFYQDFVTIIDGTGAFVHEATYVDDTEFEADVPLAPGAYTVIYTVERETGGANIDSREVTVGACPDLDVAVTPVSCSLGRDGIVSVTFSGLIPGEVYGYEVLGGGTSSAGPLVADSETVTREFDRLPPGNYYAYAQWLPPEGEESSTPMYDWRAFAVEPCQPALDVTVTECTVAGGDGTLHVAIGDLLADVVYTVDVVRAGSATVLETHTVTADASGQASLDLSLAPGATYTVTVTGSWTAPPYEEPPFIGGGDFVPLGTVALTASSDAALAPCPVAPATPATLAASGADVAGLGGAALLLVGIGAAILVSRRGARRPN
ncbi:hypothetical protein ACFPER_08300 [Agromyces aurantiacus]|uniref:LPXTG cell wall anchor domain-containing protein n=1 Tax=Agromyces aurantiacus TaxID=165814 RepID=A0ABV9R3T1_9MICO|nr:hypothetical protein [Agromyces aurantiacus]MBM7503468.1 hypothetical protein [Agromyces aurantiacus]